MHLVDRYFTRDAALIVGANLIPLLGVTLAGWNAFTLLMLYWFESAVIGVWVCIAVAISKGPLDLLGMNTGKQATGSIGMALFIAAHAGIFMFVHLFFLIGFASVANLAIDDAPDLLLRLLVDTGLWVPVAGLFVFRGLMTIADHVAGRPLDPTVSGFYLRIIIMQFVILFGGFFILLMGGSLVPLLILIVLRAAIDLGIEPLSRFVSESVSTAKAKQSTAPK